MCHGCAKSQQAILNHLLLAQSFGGQLTTKNGGDYLELHDCIASYTPGISQRKTNLLSWKNIYLPVKNY